MRVCHICLSNFFVDGRLYQENELVIQHLADGHEVTVIASTETHAGDGTVMYTAFGTYTGNEGAAVIRLPYRRGLPHSVARKVRMHHGVYRLLTRLTPDAIVFHGAAGWELLNVARYVRDHPRCIFHIDSHTDAINSARGWLSRTLLHGQFYRHILRRALKVSGPLLCVATSVMEFAASTYRVPRDRLEFFPLGGRPPSDEEYSRLRAAGRGRLGLLSGQVLLVQSGKQTRSKRLIETLHAFSKIEATEVRLAIAGVLDQEIRTEAEELIRADSRVIFLGWQNPDALTELLCAADVYVQPGTQSATMQQSLCCRCAVILADIPSHQVYRQNNGWFVTSEEDLRRAFAEVLPANLHQLGLHSYEFALARLDYATLARRVLVR